MQRSLDIFFFITGPNFRLGGVSWLKFYSKRCFWDITIFAPRYEFNFTNVLILDLFLYELYLKFLEEQPTLNIHNFSIRTVNFKHTYFFVRTTIISAHFNLFFWFLSIFQLKFLFFSSRFDGPPEGESRQSRFDRPTPKIEKIGKRRARKFDQPADGSMVLPPPKERWN